MDAIRADEQKIADQLRKLGKTVAANPPTWLMEGLASFMAQDEDSRDRMVLRDAVVNDRIPRISQNPRGYFAYRFGHAVFRYMVEKYGWDGLRDFIYEYRNTLGNTVTPITVATDTPGAPITTGAGPTGSP